MLSPREFATLMLLKDAPDQIDPGPCGSGSPSRNANSITLEKLTSGQRRPLAHPQRSLGSQDCFADPVSDTRIKRFATRSRHDAQFDRSPNRYRPESLIRFPQSKGVFP